MSTSLVKCDNATCQRTVKQAEAHGWLDVRVWVTKPTQEQFELAAMTPEGRAQIAANDIKPAATPPLVGGDFCSMLCLINYYQEQESVRHAVESPPTEKQHLPPQPPSERWPNQNRGYM